MKLLPFETLTLLLAGSVFLKSENFIFWNEDVRSLGLELILLKVRN